MHVDIFFLFNGFNFGHAARKQIFVYKTEWNLKKY